MSEMGVRCSECNRRDAVLVTGVDIYPHRSDLLGKSFYRCECGAYVGCHPGTTSPLGSCAGANTRSARSRAHAALDPLWKSGKMTRRQAYAALAAGLGIHPKRCHISWMGTDEADRAASVATHIHTQDANRGEEEK